MIPHRRMAYRVSLGKADHHLSVAECARAHKPLFNSAQCFLDNLKTIHYICVWITRFDYELNREF